MKKYFLLTILITLFLIIFSILLFGSEPFQNRPTPEIRYHEMEFTVDGIDVKLTSPFLQGRTKILPETDDPVQVANIYNRKPTYSAVTLTVIPFGTRLGSEVLPAAGPGMAETYRDLLRKFREDQGGKVREGPAASLFNEEIKGILSTVQLYIHPHEQCLVDIVEWIIESGDRIWLLRFVEEKSVQELNSAPSPGNLLNQSWLGTQLTSKSLHIPSRFSDKKPSDGEIIPFIYQTDQDDLPFPYWWDGECDTNTYQTQAGIFAYPLGGSFRDLFACGPRPWFDDGPDVLVRFFPGAWGVLEWQCTELSMRFMHLAYGIAPYQANGNQVVPHYTGDQLVKIENGTPGKPPQPNDVISSAPETTYGHTAVVIDSNLDTTGNGTITVLEQNSSETGVRIHNVVDWEVLSNHTVIGWLHDPSGDEYTIYIPLVP